jgi:hypothetical protein
LLNQPGKTAAFAGRSHADRNRPSVANGVRHEVDQSGSLLRNNAGQVATAAKDFSVSTILTTVASKIFSGSIRHPETPSGSRRWYALAAKAIRHLKPLVREEGLTPNDRGVLWDPRVN